MNFNQAKILYDATTAIMAARYTEGMASMSFDEVVQREINALGSGTETENGRPGRLGQLNSLVEDMNVVVTSLQSESGIKSGVKL